MDMVRLFSPFIYDHLANVHIDQGVMGSILVMENFQAHFPTLTGSTIQGWLVSALELGACKCELLGAKLLLLAIIWEPRHMSAPETFPTFYSQFYS
jgi:hypothetical protein